MQRVIHEYRNKSRIFTQMEGLYTYVSDTEYKFDDILWLDDSFKDLCDILAENILQFQSPTFRNFNLPRIQVNPGESRQKEVVVCLSGGKDSAAAAYYFVKLGYKVHLYHVHGVNKAYGDEQQAAERIAKYLNCDLKVENIHLVGMHKFIEHPMKNMIIANGALHYALENNYPPVISFGNFHNSSLAYSEFKFCAGDCMEMWDAYTKIIQAVIPEFKMEIPLATNADTFSILADDMDLFNMAISCMSPYRFRAYWKHQVEEKYNVRLLNNRCGTCWKCCVESIWQMDTDKVSYDETFYIHCFEVLERTIHKETGYIADSIEAVWNQYMFYPFQESKAYEVLKNKRLVRKK